MKTLKLRSIFAFLMILSSLSLFSQETGTFTDKRDGHEYKWVKIGYQLWMAENLAYLPAVRPPSSESYTTRYYYVYDFSGKKAKKAKASANYSTYGVLYNWPAAMNGATSSNTNPSKVQGVCPSGWHLPSDAEWKQLIDFISSDGYNGTEGTALKATSGWKYTKCTDNYGFSALPGGSRAIYGSFDGLGYNGMWLSATERDSTLAGRCYLSHFKDDVNLFYYYKDAGYSVRCVKDN